MAENSPAKPSPDLLYRSQIEIGRILQAVARENVAIYADLGKLAGQDEHSAYFGGARASAWPGQIADDMP
jgi:hypothetical protein